MSDQTPTSPRRGDHELSAAWWALAAGIIIVVVAGGAWIIFGGEDSAEPAPPTTTTAAQSTGPTPPATSDTPSHPSTGDGCSPATVSDDVPVTAPKADWRLVDGIALPFSDTYGPRKIASEIARCYAHSPTGAVFAAAQITTRAGQRGKSEVLRTQALPGRNRDDELNRPPLELQAPYPQIAGMKVLAYTSPKAVVQLVIRFVQDGTQVYSVSTVQMQWSGGDWKWDMDPPGGAPAPARVSTLEGFVRGEAPDHVHSD